MRQKIISKTYFIISKDAEEVFKSEAHDLTKLSPWKSNEKDTSFLETEYDSELENLLRENKPGLLDSNWVQQIRDAFKVSSDPLKVNICFNFILYTLMLKFYYIYLLHFYEIFFFIRTQY